MVHVFEEKYPTLEHGFCVRHLYDKFKKRFGGATLFRDLMMAASKETYIEAHEQPMQKINEVSIYAYP